SHCGEGSSVRDSSIETEATRGVGSRAPPPPCLEDRGIAKARGDKPESDRAWRRESMRAPSIADRPEVRRCSNLTRNISISDPKKTTPPMLGPDALDVAYIPEATFAIASAARSDVRSPRGSFAILSSRFGITPYSALGGVVREADKLDIGGVLAREGRAP